MLQLHSLAQDTQENSKIYHPLIPPISSSIENNTELARFTEKHLQVMWLEQKYFKPLITSQGELIEVISQGIWNSQPGPDFLKAHLRIGSKEVIGDIELHLLDSGWTNHGHDTDKRYDNTVLHLSLWKPAIEKTLLTVSGKVPAQAYFESKLTIPLSRITRLIDLDLYPYSSSGGSGKCSHELFEGLGRKATYELLYSAALHRLEQKKEYLESHIEYPNYRMAAGIAMALGYKSNTEKFLKLFKFLLEHQEKDEKKLLTLGLGICGFFSPLYAERWNKSPFYNTLKQSWEELACPPPQFELFLSQIRPLNHPIRRIAYLVKLVKDPLISNLDEQPKLLWKQEWPSLMSQKSLNKIKQGFLSFIPFYSDKYWNYHYLFETEKTVQPLTLLGNSLKLEIIINTFLPLLWEEISLRNIPKEQQAFHQFYASFKASKTGKTNYLSQRFFGDHSHKSLLSYSSIEQGAYQLHKDFCIHYEASCVGCPFVERYKR